MMKYYINKFAIRSFVMLADSNLLLHIRLRLFHLWRLLRQPCRFSCHLRARSWLEQVGRYISFFLALLVGIGIGSVVVALNQEFYNRRYQASGGKVLPTRSKVAVYDVRLILLCGRVVHPWVDGRKASLDCLVHWHRAHSLDMDLSPFSKVLSTTSLTLSRPMVLVQSL